ncbi:MAG: glycosyltransferase family 2 protein [Anaerolineales bacterium]|nr:glycosyltransferase family 2 protein [Anaerolineales bacterium]
MTALISVVMPMFNAEPYVIEALESVRTQTFDDLEVIVVDDGSTDGSAALVQTYAAKNGMVVRCLHQDNAGPAAARNLGLKYCRGDVITFQDADDVWAIDRLALQLELFARHPAAEIVLGMVQFYATDSDTGAMVPIGAACRYPVLHSAIFRRSVWARVGDLNSLLRQHEDIEWFNRAHHAGVNLFAHNDVVLYHRRHANNLTNVRQQQALAWLPYLRAVKGKPAEAENLWNWLNGCA